MLTQRASSVVKAGATLLESSQNRFGWALGSQIPEHVSAFVDHCVMFLGGSQPSSSLAFEPFSI